MHRRASWMATCDWISLPPPLYANVGQHLPHWNKQTCFFYTKKELSSCIITPNIQWGPNSLECDVFSSSQSFYSFSWSEGFQNGGFFKEVWWLSLLSSLTKEVIGMCCCNGDFTRKHRLVQFCHSPFKGLIKLIKFRLIRQLLKWHNLLRESWTLMASHHHLVHVHLHDFSHTNSSPLLAITVSSRSQQQLINLNIEKVWHRTTQREKLVVAVIQEGIW